MKLGIILNRVNFEEKKIIKQLQKNGHKVVQLNNQRLGLPLHNGKKKLENKFGHLDIILQRSLSLTRGLYSSAVFESLGFRVINSYDSTRICGDKLLTSLKLEENDIPTPKTSVAFKKNAALKIIDEEHNYPVVIKPIIGSWGRLIAKMDNANMASAILEDRETMGHVFQKIFYLQEYVSDSDRPENAPTDIRVIYVHGKCVGAMGRIQTDEDFRSNIALGAKAVPLEINSHMNEICQKVASAVGGDILGIDLMETKNGYVCLEVNGTPQFKGLMGSTKIDVAKEIVNYLESL